MEKGEGGEHEVKREQGAARGARFWTGDGGRDGSRREKGDQEQTRGEGTEAWLEIRWGREKAGGSGWRGGEENGRPDFRPPAVEARTGGEGEKETGGAT